jgi:hypothetical protein
MWNCVNLPLQRDYVLKLFLITRYPYYQLMKMTLNTKVQRPRLFQWSRVHASVLFFFIYYYYNFFRAYQVLQKLTTCCAVNIPLLVFHAHFTFNSNCAHLMALCLAFYRNNATSISVPMPQRSKLVRQHWNTSCIDALQFMPCPFS